MSLESPLNLLAPPEMENFVFFGHTLFDRGKILKYGKYASPKGNESIYEFKIIV